MEDGSLQKPDTVSVANLTIHTIPMEFYGGKNPAPPDIQTTAGAASGTKPLSSTEVASGATVAPKIAPKPNGARSVTTAPIKGATNKGTAIIASKAKWFWPLIIGVAVVFGGGALWWFFARNSVAPAPAPIPIMIPAATSTLAATIEVATTTAETTTSTAVTTTSTTSVSLVASHTFLDSADSDGDGLTDVEEELWSTSPVNIDTDNDTYSDQTELFNLYNPVGVAPQKIIDTPFIKTFVNSQYNYSLYYPGGWIARALDDSSNTEVLFTAITGEFIDVHAVPYPTTKSFPQWFTENLPGETLNAYQPFKNKFGVNGIISSDKLVAIISDGNSLFILSYNGGTRTDINYRSSFRLLIQSFKFIGSVNAIDIGVTVNNSGASNGGINNGAATSTTEGSSTSTALIITPSSTPVTAFTSSTPPTTTTTTTPTPISTSTSTQ